MGIRKVKSALLSLSVLAVITALECFVDPQRVYCWRLALPREGMSRKARKRLYKRQRRHNAVEELLKDVEFPEGFPERLDEMHSSPEVLPVDWNKLPALVDPLTATQTARGATWWIAKKGVMRQGDTDRFQRKRRQIEAFGAIVQRHARESQRQMTVVDFGSGSGNLVLPLAASFPDLSFIAVDRSFEATRLVEHRARESGLRNVKAWCGRIEDYGSSGLGLDLALGLHVCGEATDRVIMSAVKRKKPWAVAPCCIGAVNGGPRPGEIFLKHGEPYTLEKGSDGKAWVVVQKERLPLYGVRRVYADGQRGKYIFHHDLLPNASVVRRVPPGREGRAAPVLDFLMRGHGSADFQAQRDLVLMQASVAPLEYPRSSWLREQVSKDMFKELASVADASEEQGAGHQSIHYRAKTAVNLDRGVWAKELGYDVALFRIPGLSRYVKDDLLVGTPALMEPPEDAEQVGSP